jgi:hypothetical protein
MTARTTEQALAYAAHGWPVFPCQPGGKQPATPHGFHDATTDPDKIARSALDLEGPRHPKGPRQDRRDTKRIDQEPSENNRFQDVAAQHQQPGHDADHPGNQTEPGATLPTGPQGPGDREDGADQPVDLRKLTSADQWLPVTVTSTPSMTAIAPRIAGIHHRRLAGCTLPGLNGAAPSPLGPLGSS